MTEFTSDELAAFHLWCLKFRDLVRGGGTPSAEQEEMFWLMSRVCYEAGVAYEL